MRDPRPPRAPGPVGAAACLVAAALAGPLSAAAQEWPPCRRTEVDCVSKEWSATRLAPDRSIEIDGRLDEPAWRTAEFRADFRQKEPDEGAPPSERTEVAFRYDERTLYVGARMHSSGPVRAVLSRRDSDANSERLIVSIDSYRTRRTAWSFAVTAAGVRLDYFHFADSEFARDRSFDPVWSAATTVDSAGWTAEMAIPFSQLRYTPDPRQVWGINVNRYIPGRNEDIFWIPVPRDASGWASWFGDLVGIEGIDTGRPVELVPYLATAATLTSEALIRPDDPFRSESEAEWRAGADAKFGVGPNLTLDATFNPDFGQVEADPAEVNLSAFPTFFAERRPFFVEGQQLLEAEGLFYSRRIGAPPSGRPDAPFVERIPNTTILGAGKLTGRTASGLSIGALAAVTAEENAETFDPASGTREEVRVEPLAGWAILRARQELGASRSTVGAALTAVRRDVSPEDPLAARLAREAFGGLVDWQWRLAGGEYEIEGFLAGTRIAGDTAAIRRVQESSAHFFQRPDADYLDFDPLRTSLSGWAGELQVGRTTAEHWLWAAEVSAVSPGFDPNDAGRLRRADRIEADAELAYRENEPELFHRYSVELGTGGEWNFGGERQGGHLDLGADVTLRSFWSFGAEVGAFARARSDDLTRGGPTMGTGAGWFLHARGSTDRSRRTRVGASIFFERNELGRRAWSVGGEIETQPGGAWQLTVEPEFSWRREPRQFVGTFDRAGPATFGHRYVFGTIERSELSLQLRLDFAFTPDFSLEGYAEPFVSTGRYSRWGELEAPGSPDLRIYGTDGTTIREEEGPAPRRLTVTDGDETFGFERDDFRALSFRTNLVVRWEWRPGSTLFLVWQVDRGSFEPVTRPSGAGVSELLDGAGEPGRNFLTAKLSYWLPL